MDSQGKLGKTQLVAYSKEGKTTNIAKMKSQNVPWWYIMLLSYLYNIFSAHWYPSENAVQPVAVFLNCFFDRWVTKTFPPCVRSFIDLLQSFFVVWWQDGDNFPMKNFCVSTMNIKNASHKLSWSFYLLYWTNFNGKGRKRSL